MTSKSSQYNHKIRSLLNDKDLDGLIEILRHPANAAWRIQAAQALAELGNVDAAENLMRAILEDPEPAVQTAARQTLQQLLGSQTEVALAVHRSGPPSQEPWLITTQQEEDWEGQEEEPGAEDEREDLSDIEIDSFIRVALYEANVSTRLRAIHALADSDNLQATYALARLALWGDTRILRNAARYALEKRYGEQTEEILSSYQNTDPEESDQDASEEQIEDEEFTGEEFEEDLDEGISEIEASESQKVKYPRVKVIQDETVVEEMGTPRWLVLLGILAVLIVFALLLQPR
jgi:HEAT repeat protein